MDRENHAKKRSQIASEALAIVFQQWIVPDLGWHTGHCVERLPKLKKELAQLFPLNSKDGFDITQHQEFGFSLPSIDRVIICCNDTLTKEYTHIIEDNQITFQQQAVRI